VDAFEIERLIVHDNEVVVTYTARWRDGHAGRNTEVLAMRDGQVHAVEVSFGWSEPHDMPAGEHRDSAAPR
jgi:hypothetical protein